MKRYILSPQATQDISAIRSYLVEVGGVRAARYVVREIKKNLDFLSRTPGAGHSREDLTAVDIKFWSVFSYLIVYNPVTRSLEIVRVLHGRREVEAILAEDEG